MIFLLLSRKSQNISERFPPFIDSTNLLGAEMSLCNKIAAKDAFNKAKLDKRFRKVANDYIKNLDLYTKECNN